VRLEALREAAQAAQQGAISPPVTAALAGVQKALQAVEDARLAASSMQWLLELWSSTTGGPEIELRSVGEA